MSSPTISRRRITRSFKSRGLTLQAAALDGIVSVLQQEEGDQAEQVFTVLLNECKQRASSSPIVTTELLASVVANLARTATDVQEEAMQVLNAFETPQLQYDVMRKAFSLDKKKEKSLFGDATDKVSMLSQRFALVQQRILKQAVFRPKLVTEDGRQASSDARHVTHKITTIESMLGKSGVRFLLGMIVPGMDPSTYSLEDDSASVLMNLEHADIVTDGIFTEQCIVLVEGEVVNGVLQVYRMGHPIVETRQDAIKDMGLAASDVFSSMGTLAQVHEIQQQEVVHGPDGMLVVLSHCHLDQVGVLGRLKTLLEGFLEANPVYIFMGNFTSASCTDTKEWMGYMDDLVSLICSIPGLAERGRFLFVPGPNDPGAIHNILPRPPLPKYCTSTLRSKLSNAVLCTNPCRLRYWSKEIVLYRNNVSSLLQQANLLPGRNSISSPQHVVKTLLDQGHLSTPSRNNYWCHDHALRLYPLPDAILLGDSSPTAYFENYANCDVVHPGVFGDGDFVVYRPISETDGTSTKSNVEFSQIE